MAIAPGVPFVVLSGGRRKGGSLGFAVALAMIMQALAIVTVPITAWLIFPVNVHVPVGNLIGTLALVQLVPLLIGMFLAERAPASALRLRRPLLLVMIASIIALLVFLAPTVEKSVASVYGSNGMFAMLALVVLSIATGWVLGGPERAYRRTLGVATALRNVALAVLVATAGFPGTDVAAAVVTYFVIQIVVATIVGAYFSGPLW